MTSAGTAGHAPARACARRRARRPSCDRLERRGPAALAAPLDSGSDAEVLIDGRRVLLLSSNNYLGLADASGAASRRPREAIAPLGLRHRRLAPDRRTHSTCTPSSKRSSPRFKGTEAALLFPSGYQANVGAITALVGRGDHVFSDALNHASIIDGCRLSRATVHVYPHRDVRRARSAAGRRPAGGPPAHRHRLGLLHGRRPGAARRRWPRWREHYHAALMVDEAHATGVLGAARRRARRRRAALADAVTVHMGTLGKALGGVGAYVAGSRALVDLLVNRARSFVYTTALPPAAVAAAGAALERGRRRARAPRARSRAQRRPAARRPRRARASTSGGDTHIVPVLRRRQPPRDGASPPRSSTRGVLAQAIRPPTVPRRHGAAARHADGDPHRRADRPRARRLRRRGARAGARRA